MSGGQFVFPTHEMCFRPRQGTIILFQSAWLQHCTMPVRGEGRQLGYALFSFLGLGPELETKQAFQPLALLCPPNLAWKDKEWTKVGSKWKCKVGTCTVTYYAKWLSTKHLKEVHGLAVEKSKPGRPSTSTGGP
jgi:hypothetical protein